MWIRYLEAIFGSCVYFLIGILCYYIDFIILLSLSGVQWSLRLLIFSSCSCLHCDAEVLRNSSVFSSQCAGLDSAKFRLHYYLFQIIHTILSLFFLLSEQLSNKPKLLQLNFYVFRLSFGHLREFIPPPPWMRPCVIRLQDVTSDIW